MSHFAQVENGIVTQVIKAEQDVIDSELFGTGWIQTSYNTRGNVHEDSETRQPDGGVALRGNYAGIGYTYDSTHDVFYAPQPFPSWSLSQTTWLWESPTAYPNDDKNYYWDESTLTWIEIKT
jgi:hypothetical protein